MIASLVSETKAKIVEYAKRMPPIVADFGDYIPFLAYLGERDLCSKHLKAIAGDVCQPALPTDREDTLLGLIDLYRWNGEEEALVLAEQYVEYLLSNFSHNGRIAVEKGRFLNEVGGVSRRDPVTRTFTKAAHWLSPSHIYIPRNGLYIELLVDLYEMTGKAKYLESARQMAYAWCDDEAFRKYGLFERYRLNNFGKRYGVLTKDNTAILHGLISIYQVTRDEKLADSVRKWFDAIRLRYPSGLVTQQVYMNSRNGSKPELQAAQALLDVLCDGYRIMGLEEMLTYARKICDYWLQFQSSIGLFPVTPGSNISWQDGMTDFSISLWSVHELTGIDLYREAAERTMEGLFRYHAFPLLVDYKTGKALDTKVVPKFVLLMLKPVILLSTGSIYKDERIYKLMRDR